MIVHGEDEAEESDSRSQLVKEKESSSSQVEGVSREVSGEELPDSWYFICVTLFFYFFGGRYTYINRRLNFPFDHPIY